MYQAISMVFKEFDDDDDDVSTPNKVPRLFQLIVELANLGVMVNMQEDFGGNTLTVACRYASIPGVDPRPPLEHFHSGYPDCSTVEGEASLVMHLQRVINQVRKESL